MYPNREIEYLDIQTENNDAKKIYQMIQFQSLKNLFKQMDK